MLELISDKTVIFFDVGYTIDYPASGDWMLTKRFYEIAGERLDSYSKDQIIKAKMAGVDFLEKNHLVLTEEEEAKQYFDFYRIVAETLQLNLTDDEITEIANDRTYNMANYIIYPDAEKVIKTLSESHRLGIISDTWPSIENQLRSINVLQYFSYFTYSFSLGVFKPDKRMYLDALEKCGCDAKDTVFIDDSIQNLEGAAALGITPILIDANPASDAETSFMKIHSLSELIK